MTITREIDGKAIEIELTSRELYDAYVEQEHYFDKCDIEDMIVGWEDDDIVEVYGVTRDAFESLVEEMAYRKRRYMDKYDVSWDYARDEAIRDVIREEKGGSA